KNEGSAPEEATNAATDLTVQLHKVWEDQLQYKFAEPPEDVRQAARRETYQKALEVAKGLRDAENYADAKSQRVEFWELHSGKLLFVETLEVSTCMGHVGLQLNEWKKSQANKPAELEDRLKSLIGQLQKELNQ